MIKLSVNWIKIRNEYITGNISYRKLAEKYGVTFSALRYKAEADEWAKSKKKQQHKTSTKLAQKTAEKIIEKEVNRIDRLYSTSDKIIHLLNTSLDQMMEQTDIDTYQLRQLSSTLKDIKEIQTTMQDSKDTITEQTNKNRETLAELLSNPQPNRELPTDE